jgi:hypothetical protein
MMLMSPWTDGPEAAPAGSVVVSVTDFAPHRRRDVPLITRTGLRLRRGWFAMPGAVGLCLWSDPLVPRSGSISVWTSEEDLQRFIRLPAHVAIMRRFRDRGTLRSTSWSADGFDPSAVVAQARGWIA